MVKGFIKFKLYFNSQEMVKRNCSGYNIIDVVKMWNLNRRRQYEIFAMLFMMLPSLIKMLS